MDPNKYTTGTRVAWIAAQAAMNHKYGGTHYNIAGIRFDLVTFGYCERFVRQSVEAAMQRGEHVWKYAQDNARNTEAAIKAAGAKPFTSQFARPGMVVAMNTNTGKNGHIGICVRTPDGLQVAHNTSNRNWCWSYLKRSSSLGTIISPFSTVRPKISGIYPVLPEILVVAPDGNAIDCGAYFDGEAVIANLSVLFRELGKPIVASAPYGLFRPALESAGYHVDGSQVSDWGIVRLAEV